MHEEAERKSVVPGNGSTCCGGGWKCAECNKGSDCREVPTAGSIGECVGKKIGSYASSWKTDILDSRRMTIQNVLNEIVLTGASSGH